MTASVIRWHAAVPLLDEAQATVEATLTLSPNHLFRAGVRACVVLAADHPPPVDRSAAVCEEKGEAHVPRALSWYRRWEQAASWPPPDSTKRHAPPLLRGMPRP